MIQKKKSIFEAATQLVSLDCSSITAQNTSISHNTSHSLHQSILNLKTVFPTFTSEFTLFKEEIIDMSYFIVNKLMTVIKSKSSSITQLEKELQKSQTINNGMKKQVIQLQQMISEFMESYKKQMQQKEKQISQKEKQMDQLKTVLKLNFNSPRNFCYKCQHKIQNPNINTLISETLQNTKQSESFDLKMNNVFKSYGREEQMLIEMNQSIVCNTEEINTKKSLQVIQEESSEVTSLTDYLQSQRCSQKQNTCQSISQMIKSSRSGQTKQKEKQTFLTGKRSALQGKITQVGPQSRKNQSECDKTVKDNNSPVEKIKFFQSLQNKNFYDTFSSRITNKNYTEYKPQSLDEKERRNSEIIIAEKAMYDGFNIERKTQQRNAVAKKLIDDHIVPQNKQLSLKAQLEQISKSSSCNDLIHLGDSEKINVNLPKKFDSPKKMNFVKKNSSNKDERLKTQPSPRNSKYEINKQNIHIEYQPKPIEMGRKIFARKKMIMTHAKASTSRMDTKLGLKQIPYSQLMNHARPTKTDQKKDGFIQIKFIESPQKQPSKSSHLLKPSVATIFSVNPSEEGVPRKNSYMQYGSVASNISAINDSSVKTHHMYHSTGKYPSQQTPKNIHKITMTPGKSQSKALERKSTSKSKQKLKVTSKSGGQDQSSHINQRFLTEMNHNLYTSNNNNQSISKLKSKNLSVRIGSTNNKSHLKKNLAEIKKSLVIYNLNQIFSSLTEVYYDGKLVNGVKEGYGKVVYDNGLIYEGLFKAGRKQGQSKFILNGIEIYEGDFCNDMINGQGYLKFFRYLATSSCPCPKILQNASFYGSFSHNSFDGMGTLFLNQNQKIVTKFSKGIPFGELTFYTQDDIDFGHWPTDL